MKTERSEHLNEFAAALAKAQGKFKAIEKNAVVEGKTFGYSYATLDIMLDMALEVLSENGIAVVQTPLGGLEHPNTIFMETLLIHSSGQWISGVLPIPIVPGRMNELQALGSTISYARRYMFGPMVGISAKGEDDDGQAGGGKGDPIMTPDLMITRLEREPGVEGFYKSPGDVISALDSVKKWPKGEDVESWKVIFERARDHALKVRHQKTLSDGKGWQPGYGEFYKHMLPIIPNLLKGSNDDDAKQVVVGNLCKDHAKVDKWDPLLANGLKEYLLGLEKAANQIYNDEVLSRTEKDKPNLYLDDLTEDGESSTESEWAKTMGEEATDDSTEGE